MAKLMVVLVVVAIFCTFVWAQDETAEDQFESASLREIKEAKADLGYNFKEEQVKPFLTRLIREANADPHHKGYYYKGHNKGWKGKGHYYHKGH